jgi:hypothetical protein
MKSDLLKIKICNLQFFLSVVQYQTQPVFELDLKIKNEKFTVVISPNQKWFTTIKLELIETNPIA